MSDYARFSEWWISLDPALYTVDHSQDHDIAWLAFQKGSEVHKSGGSEFGEVERVTCSHCGAQVLCGTFIPSAKVIQTEPPDSGGSHGE